MKIVTEYRPKPIPTRDYDWSAIDADSYDGAPDSSTRNQVGYGMTQSEAVFNLCLILVEAQEENEDASS